MKPINDKKVNNIMEKEQYYKDEDYDNLNYFIKNRKIIPTSFEDGVTRGGNIDSYRNYGGLNDIGKIKLDNKKIIYAKPTNYLFNGSEI
jgi:hypothetical protein